MRNKLYALMAIAGLGAFWLGALSRFVVTHGHYTYHGIG